MNIKIIVAAHKPYRMPEDKIYLPVHVGAEGKESIGFRKDCEGENISAKNPNYCELTGLYWAWKNLDADVFGLVHYRRYFTNGSRCSDKWKRIISGNELRKKLGECSVLLPKKRNYWIESNHSQYVHAHHSADLDTAREILAEKYPSCLEAYDRVMKRTKGHRFNMFVMDREHFDRWCGWLFDVLFELEKRLDISGYSQYDARVFGFVGERLLDVWLEANGIKYRELPYVFMEKQNWIIKGGNFLKRKFSAHGNGKQS